jgi:hypothetical protein
MDLGNKILVTFFLTNKKFVQCFSFLLTSCVSSNQENSVENYTTVLYLIRVLDPEPFWTYLEPRTRYTECWKRK